MAIEKVINLVVDSDEAVKGINEVDKSIQNVEQSSKNLETQNKKTTKGFKTVSTAVKGLGVALKAAGIGLIIAAFAKLTELLSENQKVVDFANTVWTAFGTVVKDIGNALLNFDETLITVGDTIKNIVLDRITNTIKGIQGLGLALTQFFSGQFKSAVTIAGESLKTLVAPGETLVNLADATKEYTTDIIEQADAYTKLANAAQIAEAQQRRIFEQYDRDAEIQRRIRDDFELTAEERLAANEKLKDILDEQERIQLRLGQISVDAAQKEIELKGRTTERIVALTNALAEQDAIEADIAGRRAEQEAQDRALRQELLQIRQDEIGNLIETENLRVEVVEDSVDREVQARLNGIAAENEMREKSAREEAARAQNLEDFKLNIAQAGLASLSLLAEQGSGFAKAVGVAQAIISTYQGINKALAETTDFTPTQTLRFANAAAVGFAGFANVANILKQQPVAKGGGAGSSAPSQPAAPSFNIVGASPVNQLADTLNQGQDPVQAFVVGSNVTSQQELDRNITETATIG